MSKVKLRENEELLVHRMAMSGGRAIYIDENKQNDLLREYGISEKRFKSLCRQKVFKRDKQPDGTIDIVFGSWGSYYVKKEITEMPPQSASVHHDRGQYKAVKELSKKELESAMSAREFIHEHRPDLDHKHTPDLIYYSDATDSWEALETITRDYKGAEIDRKVEWVRKANMGVHLNDIDGNRGGYRR